MIPVAELVAIQRSAAMLREGQTYALPCEVLIELVGEVLEARQLLERLGGDRRGNRRTGTQASRLTTARRGWTAAPTERHRTIAFTAGTAWGC